MIVLLQQLVIPTGMHWSLVLSVAVVLLVAVPVMLITHHLHAIERADVTLGAANSAITLPRTAWMAPMVQRLAPTVVPPSVTVTDQLREATETALRRGTANSVAVLIIEVCQPTVASSRLGLSTVELSALLMRLLRTQLPREHSIARLTAHRFAILAEGLSPGSVATQTEQVARLIGQPLRGDGRTAVINFAIGAAGTDRNITTANQLVRAAQRAHAAAAHEAMTGGTGTIWRVFEAQMGPPSAEVDVRALSRAITGGTLRAGFRPLIRPGADAGTVSALHVLPLWTDRRGRIINSVELSTAARSLHLATTASRLGIEDCLGIAAAWNAEGILPSRLQLEIEPELLSDPDFPAILRGSMNRRGVPTSAITLVTDARLAGLEADLLRPAVTQLRAQGLDVLLNHWNPTSAVPLQGGSNPVAIRPPTTLPISGVILDPALAGMIHTEPKRLRQIVAACHSAGLTCQLDGLTEPGQFVAAAELGLTLLGGPAVGTTLTAAEMTARFTSSQSTIYS